MSEINNAWYEEAAQTWWQAGSALSMLHLLNPGRFGYLDSVMTAQGLDYSDCRVLDIGCGGGFICEEFAKRDAQVSGVDPSPGTITEASRHAQEMGFNIQYKEGTGEQLPFADNSFDLVSCCDVLEHVQDLDQVLRETARVLKPGGLYFYDTINRTFLSWLLMIKLFQDWPLTRRVPKNTHVWNMFIKPQELKTVMTRVGLQQNGETGLGINIAWRSIPSALAEAASERQAGLALNPIQAGPVRSKRVLYMGWAVNRAPAK